MESEICSKKSKIKDCAAVAELPDLSNGGISLLLTAQTPDRTNDGTVVSSDSPLTWVNDSEEEDGVDLESSPTTPKAAVFDPFAPGPDDLANAPVKKFGERSKIDVVRRLNFEDSDEHGVLCLKEEEEVMLGKMLYESLFDFIFSEQAQQGDLPQSGVGRCGVTTPTKLVLLTGIAETCPGAPRKTRPNSRIIDLGLCRKLEF